MGIACSYFNLSTRWGWVVNAMPQLLYPWEGDQVPIVLEDVWAPGLVWMGAENLHKYFIPLF